MTPGKFCILDHLRSFLVQFWGEITIGCYSYLTPARDSDLALDGSMISPAEPRLLGGRRRPGELPIPHLFHRNVKLTITLRNTHEHAGESQQCLCGQVYT